MRRLIMLSVLVGCSASVPLVYQSNPELFHDLLRREPAAAAPEPTVSMVAAAVPTRPKQPLGRKALIRMDDRGHFQAEFKLNGRRVDAMVDTGATMIAFNSETARRLGIPLSTADYRYKVTTANGKVAAAAVTLDSVQLGRIHLENIEAVVLADQSLAGTLIGMSFLKRLDSFRVEGRDLILEQ